MNLLQQKPELADIVLSCIAPLEVYVANLVVNYIIGASISMSVYLLLFVAIIFAVNKTTTTILTSKIYSFAVYWRSCLILHVMLIGYLITVQDSHTQLKSFGIYLIFLSIFHLSEYLTTLLFNYSTLKLSSFLLNHSFEYNMAAVVSWIEYFIEVLIFPQLKEFQVFWYIGLILIISGEFVRKLAMYTAGTNFNHLIQTKKSNTHELVTHGIYSFSRHPSYFGWFYWSIGTQILLANPLCICAYAYASWKFFNSRIIEEEFHLKNFFGKQYDEYAKCVPIRIPFIKGYIDYKECLD